MQLAQAGAHVVAVARTVGGLEELDDEIKAAGGTATLVPLDLKDNDGIARLALALNERYGRLDMLVGNAGMLGPLSPLGHIEPKDWDNVIAVNVTANWQLIRCMRPAAASASDAGRAVFVTSAVAYTARAYWGPYAVSKAALERAGAHLCGGKRDHECARQSVQRPARPAPACICGRLPRRRSDDAADAGRGGESDRAAVPARLHGERKDLRFPRRQVLGIPGAGLSRAAQAAANHSSSGGIFGACSSSAVPKT